jgi:mono/diheme cytochrome c family protein
MTSTTDALGRACLAVALAACALAACALAGCARKDAAPARGSAGGGWSDALAERGAAIFRNTAFGDAELACADCHADHPDDAGADDRIRPGHPIPGAARRVETWNGEFSGARLAVTAAGAAKCAFLYQGRGDSLATALAPGEAAALMAYYASISTGSEPVRLAWTAVDWPGNTRRDTAAIARDIAGIEAMTGDARRGEALFDRACALCHGANGRMVGPALRIVRKHPERVADHVRRGHKDMPFFARDKLTDAQIADILAYIRGG